MAHKFAVALYVRRRAAHIERVASCLKTAGLKVFYDVDEEADLWGKEL